MPLGRKLWHSPRRQFVFRLFARTARHDPPYPDKASDIQRLYKRNCRRSVTLILKSPSRPCTISLEKPPGTLGSHLDICNQLRKTKNTARGGDRLTYHHWRTVDPEARFLSALLNACVHHKRTPDSCRTSRTVLIYKKGDSQVPGNWRPIALGCTASNLYAKCLAGRFQDWILEHRVLSHCQKGFLPADGVFELNCSSVASTRPSPGLQRRIDRVEVLATSLGLALNSSKCTSLHMSRVTPVGMRPVQVTVSGATILAIRDHTAQRFLGSPAGFQLVHTDGSIADTAINQARTILSSMLAPWQRLDAVRTFVYPALNFAMRCGVLSKTLWKRLDDAVRPLVKMTLYLPSNATNGYSRQHQHGRRRRFPSLRSLATSAASTTHSSC
ncbi:hypothetical protein MTO96_029594 [Rhipicephalus appendiculatus]